MAALIQPLVAAKAVSDPAAGAKAAQQNDAMKKDAFLKLLIAQVRHQNPLNPADGVEFLTQLTQFSQLEQTMAMREELELIRETMTQPAGNAGE